MRQERTHAGAIVVATLATLPVVFPTLYVLSLGPAVWMLHADWLNGEVLRAAYYPLIVLADESKLASNFFDWYVEL
jgi:hypothetical protein